MWSKEEVQRLSPILEQIWNDMTPLENKQILVFGLPKG